MTAENYYQQGVYRYVSQQDSQGAIESFTKAIELDPNHVLAYYNRGVTKLRLDNPEGAKADLMKAREIYASRGDESGVYQAEDRLQQIKENHGI
jgi:tetratricopeptide (TPR) repeat protein